MFAFGERHILCNDEKSNDIAVFDTLSGEHLDSLGGHKGNVQNIAVSNLGQQRGDFPEAFQNIGVSSGLVILDFHHRLVFFFVLSW